jgi:hypothetical protein
MHVFLEGIDALSKSLTAPKDVCLEIAAAAQAKPAAKFGAVRGRRRCVRWQSFYRCTGKTLAAVGCSQESIGCTCRLRHINLCARHHFRVQLKSYTDFL